MVSLADYLAEIAAGRQSCEWPAFVATSKDVDLGKTADVETTLTAVGHAPVFSRRTANQFMDLPCVFALRPTDGLRLSVGRSRDNDYRITHQSVSGSHAELVIAGADDYQIVDLSSRNGTFVETERITPGEPALMHGNSLVRFGDANFYVIAPEMAAILARMSNPV